MSLIPEFEIGLWNAWILTLALLAFHGLSFWILKGAALFIWPQYNKQEKRLLTILTVALVASVIYSIFIPLKLGTTWFYAGLSMYLLGLICDTMAKLSFATTSLDKPVTKGIFRISRNPMNIGWFLIFIGIGIACASWIFLLWAVVFIILQHILVIPEERFCLEKYGDAYRDYMNRTPRWIGLLKS